MNRFALGAMASVLMLAGCSRAAPVAQQSPKALPVETPAPSPSASAPVALSGPVDNRGVKDLTGLGSNIALELELDDFYFSPTFIKAVPGASVTLGLGNEGKAEHTFTIDALKVDKAVPAGQTGEVTFKLPESGVVEFYCRIHFDRSMRGAFYFDSGATPPAAATFSTGAPSSSGSSSGSSNTTSAAPVRRTSARPAAVRTSSAAAPEPPGTQSASAQNQPGDLVIPDLILGEPQKGAGSGGPAPAVATSPRPPANSTSSPRIGSSSTGSPNNAGTSSNGTSSNGTSSQGKPGTSGVAGVASKPVVGD